MRIIADPTGWVPSHYDGCHTAEVRAGIAQGGAGAGVVVLAWIAMRYRFVRTRYEAWRERMNGL